MNKIILLLLLIVSCAPLKQSYVNDPREQALYCGMFAARYNESRIVFTPATLPSQWRAQAKTRINGEWKWLQMKKDGSCYISSQDWFEPLNEFSVSDFEKFLNDWDNLRPELRLPSAGKF